VTISPDDPGFMGYEGVTLDYFYAFLAWDLDLKDMKKLALNSITWAAIYEDEKVELKNFFEHKWSRFLDHVMGRY
jgi:Adenosine deaminase